MRLPRKFEAWVQALNGAWAGDSNMISGQKMQDIAQLVRMMADPIAKNYVVNRWIDLREKQKEKDDDWADQLIEALLTEQIEKISKYL